MTDKELIEFAAKGAGYPISDGYSELMGGKLWWVYLQGSGDPPNDSAWYEIWNPLEDDGDALRLAVKLQINIYHGESLVSAVSMGLNECGVFEDKVGDSYPAIRRAIVRAAAEIGKGME
jgi:hypothetical protein